MTKGQRYYQRNRDAIRAKAREKYLANIEAEQERARESAKRCRAANPGSNAAKCREYYHKNRERIRAQIKAHRAASPEYRKQERTDNLWRLYRITHEQYDAMHAAQGGVCAICGKPETYLTGRNRTLASLAVDHDRETGKVRDLLCSRCNRGIGLLQHDPEILQSATAYMLKHAPK